MDSSDNAFEKDVKEAVKGLLKKQGQVGPMSVTAMLGGGNARGYRLQFGKEQYFLKLYFQHPDDHRERLETEFRFCEFLWENGISRGPKPLGMDRDLQFGLYEFIEGRKLQPGQIDDNAIRQLSEFMKDLSMCCHSESVCNLNNASEAFFSIEGHIRCVETRLTSLLEMEVNNLVSEKACEFVHTTLYPTWMDLKNSILTGAEKANLDCSRVLTPSERCISPSDFGFHNAILQDDSRLRFIDFEYAGWDDPVKMLCDIFCQPAVPVPKRHFHLVYDALRTAYKLGRDFTERVKLLYPLFSIKWCCILLNPFLSLGKKRKTHAMCSDIEVHQQLQLNKAIKYYGNNKTLTAFPQQYLK